MSKVLSIFCDESGDFGPYSKYSACYIIGFVFHDQDNDILSQIDKLKSNIEYQSYPQDRPIHTLPLIRGEYDYRNLNREERMKLLSTLSAFYRKCPINTATVIVNKKELAMSTNLEKELTTKINSLILQNKHYFKRYKKIILYYDSGQKKLTNILKSCFTTNFNSVEFRTIKSKDYYLFQVADLVCTLKLLKFKYPNLTKREI